MDNVRSHRSARYLFSMRSYLCFLRVALAVALASCHQRMQSTTVGRATGGQTLPPGVTAALIAEGDSIFNFVDAQGKPANCTTCHGRDARGAELGPSFKSGPWLQSRGSYEEIVATITNGVPREKIKVPSHRFFMTPRGGPMKLSDAQIRAVGAYIWSISREKTPPQ